LDEVASVDTRTEVLAQKAMSALHSDRTSFVIAHRLSTIRDADLILVMESRAARGPDGPHGWEYEAMLVPLKATARRLGMDWQEPLVIHGVRELDDAGIRRIRNSFHELLTETREEHRPVENLSPFEPANS
jgi:hypothetical protein